MSDEKAVSKIADASNAVTGVLKEVPVYKDAVQLAAKQLGQSLATIAKALDKVLLGPLRVLIWGVEEIEQNVMPQLAQKLHKLTAEQLATPSLMVVGPAIESLRFAGHEPTLCEMYVNLLATAIDRKTAENAHPTFVHIIRNLCPDEALMLKFLGTCRDSGVSYKCTPEESEGRLNDLLGVPSGIKHLHLLKSYIDNTKALGITWGLAINTGISGGAQTHTNSVLLTALGKQFMKACVIPLEHS